MACANTGESPYEPSGFVEAAGSEFVAAGVEIMHIEGEACEKAQLFEAQIGPHEMFASLSCVGGRDQRLLHIEGGELA